MRGFAIFRYNVLYNLDFDIYIYGKYKYDTIILLIH